MCCLNYWKHIINHREAANLYFLIRIKGWKMSEIKRKLRKRDKFLEKLVI